MNWGPRSEKRCRQGDTPVSGCRAADVGGGSLRRRPQWLMGAAEGRWPGRLDTRYRNLSCSLFSLLHLPFLPLRSEVAGMFISVFKNAWGGRWGTKERGN